MGPSISATAPDPSDPEYPSDHDHFAAPAALRDDRCSELDAGESSHVAGATARAAKRTPRVCARDCRSSHAFGLVLSHPVESRWPLASGPLSTDRQPPPAAVEEAKRQPNGWVYEIVGGEQPDEVFHPNGYAALGKPTLRARSSANSLQTGVSSSRRSKR